LRRFIGQLALRLQVLYLSVAEMDLTLGLCSGEACQKLFLIPAPTREIETLFRILFTHLENTRTESPAASLRLSFRAQPAKAGPIQPF
jgi:hypothetical protein